jgi:hypothetical protein
MHCKKDHQYKFKKVMYAIFFTTLGSTIQVAVPKGESVNAKLYKFEN